MSKITLTSVSNMSNETAYNGIINNNNQVLQTAFDNTLSRDGTTPNQMGADFDMNSHRILNLPAPFQPTDVVRLEDMQTIIGGGTIAVIPPGGNPNAVLQKNSATNYDWGWTNAITNCTYNGLTVSTTTGVLTIANAKTLTVNNSLILAGIDGTTLTFQGTDTYVGRATTDTLTNKTFDTAGTGNVFKINGNQISSNTGTGSVNVLQTSPSLITPALGVATATSINGLTITTSTGTLTIANGKTHAVNNSITLSGVDGKTLTVNNNLTFAGTDGTTMTFPGASDTVVTLGATQTLTSKTLTAPTITAPSFSTDMLFTGVISPTTLAANTNNWNPTGVATANIVRMGASTPVNVTGLVAQTAGTVITLINISANNITLTNQDASSTAANQFNLGNNTILGAGQAISLWYDGTSSVWRPLGGSGSGGGAGSATFNQYEYSATAGQTAFSGLDSNGATLAYTVGYLETYVNGFKLNKGDFTATTGTSVTMPSGLYAGDLVTFIAFSTFNSANALQNSNNLSDVSSVSTARSNLGLGGTPVLLETLTPSAVASIATSASWSGYSMIEIVYNQVIPVTTNVSFELQVHSGGAYQTTSYLSTVHYSGGTTPATTTLATAILISVNASVPNTSGVSGSLRIHNPNNTTSPKHIMGLSNIINTTSFICQGGGFWNGGNGALDGCQFLFSSGNISSGTIKIYGWP